MCWKPVDLSQLSLQALQNGSGLPKHGWPRLGPLVLLSASLPSGLLEAADGCDPALRIPDRPLVSALPSPACR